MSTPDREKLAERTGLDSHRLSGDLSDHLFLPVGVEADETVVVTVVVQVQEVTKFLQ